VFNPNLTLCTAPHEKRLQVSRTLCAPCARFYFLIVSITFWHSVSLL